MSNEYLVYSKDCGFNIVKANSEQQAEESQEGLICLDSTSEVDSVILNRIRELIN